MGITHVEMISHVADVLKAKEEAVQKALIMCGELFEGEAKDEISRPKAHADGTIRPNVDTGRLRNSITYATKTMHSTGSFPAELSDYALHGQVKDNEVVVGTNVEYVFLLTYAMSY